ncbi:MAG TPA: aminotransferase class IV [Thermoanaerobaculia bacterium]|nr:aminotransferase class IV [Thermoanaerobaculia bacterium]
MRGRISFWNGRAVPSGEVLISPEDAGFLTGDGLFETLRVDDGQALDVEAHLDRLLAGLGRVEIALPESRDALAEAVALVAQVAPRPIARLRITVTRGTGNEPTRLIAAAPYRPPEEEHYRNGVAALLLPDLWIDSRGPLTGLKSLCWQVNRLALLRAERAGAFEALLSNEQGRVAEGARSNLIVHLAEGIFTPPATDGCLPGTVRRHLLELGEIAERSLGPDDLERALEILLTNSLIGVLPVGRLECQSEGKPLKKEIAVGQTARRLRAAADSRLRGGSGRHRESGTAG